MSVALAYWRAMTVQPPSGANPIRRGSREETPFISHKFRRRQVASAKGRAIIDWSQPCSSRRDRAVKELLADGEACVRAARWLEYRG
jgi:hypothetical protein